MPQGRSKSWRVIIFVLLLLVPAWFVSPLLVGDVATALLALGFEKTSFAVARLAEKDEIADDELAVYSAMAELTSKPLVNDDKTVYLWLPKEEFPKETAAKVLELFSEARLEVAKVLGCPPATLWVRAPRHLQERHMGGFGGLFIDVRLDTLLDTHTVYHEVTHATLLEAVSGVGLPTDYPLWFDEGLAEFVPSFLGKTTDYKLFRSPKRAHRLEFSALDWYILGTRDYFPACTVVGKLFELCKQNSDGLPALLKRLRRGDHFIQAVQRAAKVTEHKFARDWEDEYNQKFVEQHDDPSFLIGRANELLLAGNIQIAWVYVGRLKGAAKQSADANFIRAKILLAEAERFRAKKFYKTSVQRLRLAVKALDRIDSGLLVPKARALEDKARALWGEGKMLAAAAGARAEEEISGLPLADENKPSVPKRGSSAMVRVIFPPALVLILILVFICLRYVALPLLVLLWDYTTGSGSVIGPCLLVLLFSIFTKICFGIGFNYCQLIFANQPLIGSSGLFLIYCWVTSLAIWIIGGKIFSVSGGEDPGGFWSLAMSTCVFLVILGGFATILWRVEMVSLIRECSPLAFIHALMLSFVMAAGQETFFRGGLFKSAELSLHVGSAAVVTSLLWAVFHTSLAGSWSSFIVSFVFGILMCSLVTRTGRLGLAIGAAFVVNVVDFVLLGATGDPFSLGLLSGKPSPWTTGDGTGLAALPAWLPLLFVAWCFTLLVINKRFNRDNRTSRIFLSSTRY